jgi:hypothetical protein
MRNLMIRVLGRRETGQGGCSPDQLAYAQRESA